MYKMTRTYANCTNGTYHGRMVDNYRLALLVYKWRGLSSR